MEVVDILQNSIHIQRKYNFTNCTNLPEAAEQIVTKLERVSVKSVKINSKNKI